MPIHDWTRVPAGIFHDFHHAWIEEIKRAVNRALPADYYALAEQLIGEFGPDVLALHAPTNGDGGNGVPHGGVKLDERRPKARFHTASKAETYADKAKAVVIRHASDHDVVAMLEVVSSGNKTSKRRINTFVRKATETLAAGIHLLIVDLFPPTPRDPEGVHRLIWEDREDEFIFDAAKPLTLVSYIGDPRPEAFIEPVAVGEALPEMPLFITPEVWIPVPLDATYKAAWREFPAVWQKVLVAERQAP